MRRSLNCNPDICFSLFLCSLLALRIFAIYINSLELYADEAQYWVWSKNLDLGYYSKPPMVAWCISLTTYFLGDGEFAVRISSPILHFITSVVVYFIGRNFGRQIAILSGIIYATMPAVFISSLIISTDPLLLLFWSLSLCFLIKGIKTKDYLYWSLCGLSSGLGMLSKYNMLFFLFSVVLYLYYIHRSLKFLWSTRFIIAISIAFLLFLPNLAWNISNMFVSFSHTADLVHGDINKRFSFLEMAKFFIAQFGVFGPINFSFLLVAIYYYLKRSISKQYIILIYFSVPTLFIMLMISFFSRAHANWAAPIYIASSILVVLMAKDLGKLFWLKLGIYFQIIIGVILLFHQPILHYYNININYKYDIFRRLKGGKILGEQIIMIHEKYPNNAIALDTRREISLAKYYAKGHNINIIKWNPYKTISDYYAVTTDANKLIGGDILLLLYFDPHQQRDLNNFSNYATEIRDLGFISYPKQYILPEKYQVLQLYKFKGY